MTIREKLELMQTIKQRNDDHIREWKTATYDTSERT